MLDTKSKPFKETKMKNLKLLLMLTHKARIEDAQHFLKKLQIQNRYENQNLNMDADNTHEQLDILRDTEKMIGNVLKSHEGNVTDKLLDRINEILFFQNKKSNR